MSDAATARPRWLPVVVLGILAVLTLGGAGYAFAGGMLPDAEGTPVGSAAPVADDEVGPGDDEVGPDDDEVGPGDANERDGADAEQTRAAEEAEAAAEAEQAAEEAAERQAETERIAEEAAEAERLAEEERLAAEEAQREAEEEAARQAEEERQQMLGAQERLTELGYLIGAVDGEQGQQTTAALMAFQAVNGIQVDGILGPQTLETLATPLADPQLRGGPNTRIEVDLDRQVLHLVEGGQRTVTFKTSTGNGQPYERSDGSTVAAARTPVGEFTITRRIEGVRESSAGLGTLFDPMYFFRGFAIHGSNSVPAGPASHGCVRLPRADAVWLFDRVPNGTPVHLYGGEHAFPA